MIAYICTTCGTQFAPTARAPDRCPVCLDERQFVGLEGQQWTSAEELARTHRNQVEELEPGLLGIGVEPSFGIGQRALVVERLLWDCVSVLDVATAEQLSARGGIETIAISHPHFYTAMVDWAERFDARVLLHEADRDWIMRPSPRIELWSGERLTASEAITLVRIGGHFPGATACLWHRGAGGAGVLLSGDIPQVVQDRDWVSFMWSYPNLIPLPAREITRIRGVLEALRFDRLYGGWWDRVIEQDAHAKVLRSAERYLGALS